MNKPIYEPRGRAREYGELAVNIYILLLQSTTR